MASTTLNSSPPTNRFSATVPDVQDKFSLLREYITLLADDSSASQLEALKGMDYILPRPRFHDPSEDDEPLYNILHETGAIDLLSSLLASPSDDVLTHVVQLFEKIPYDTDEFSKPLEPETDVIGALSNRLLSPDRRLFETTVNALGFFLVQIVPKDSGDIIVKTRILQSDVFKDILKLATSFNPQIQENALHIIRSIGSASKPTEDVNACVDAGVPQTLFSLLTSGNPDTQFWTVDAVLTFVNEDPDGQFANAFLSANILGALSPLSRSGNVQAKMTIIRIITGAPLSSPLEKYIHPDIINIIIGLLPSRFRESGERAITSILRRYQYVSQELVMTTLIKPITSLLSSSDKNFRAGAARAVWLIARDDNRCFAMAFVTAGVAKPLAKLLLSKKCF